MNKPIFKAADLNFKDIPRVDAHMHTSWTDGTATISEMYASAVNKKMHQIIFSEHCRKSSVSWFSEFASEVRSLFPTSCHAHVGAEVKVLSHGGEIDADTKIIDECDFVIGSVHRMVDADGNCVRFSDLTGSTAMELEYRLTMGLLSNPNIDILGHMFGMSYRKFGVLPSQDIIFEVIEQACKFDVAIEINSKYHPDLFGLIELCKRGGAKISLGSDAHSVEEVGNIVYSLERGESYAQNL